jgi:hypothetical protein
MRAVTTLASTTRPAPPSVLDRAGRLGAMLPALLSAGLALSL